MNLWSYTTEYFNTKHCHSPHTNFIYPILHNTTPTHKNGFLEDSYNTHNQGEPLGLHNHSLKCSTTVCDFLIIQIWTFWSHMMHSYNISLHICYGYIRRFWDNVILMMSYKLELSQVEISVLNISMCILYVTTLFFVMACL